MSGHTHGFSTGAVLENFWDMAMPLPWSGCWIWMGHTTTRGYGQLGSRLRAHRVAWELANGEKAPKDKLVCHKCDVPLCVNPDHLFIGTCADNVHDMISKGRHVLNGRPRKGQVVPGSVIGDWTTTNSNAYRANGKRYVWCVCKCGIERFVYDYDLHSGKSKGCGRHAYS